MKQAIRYSFQIFLCSCSIWSVSGKVLLAQVVPDNTVNTQVERDGSVAEITGGETRGENLFHSFQDFSIPTGNEAFFNNANNIYNIFSRVTGNSISEIDGTIRANGSANLFLINPAGIIFNDNASLDIGGSFYGSTANSIVFEEGEFSVIAPESESILTISVPIGLRFEDNPGDIINNSIVNDGVGLEVVTGKNIALLGGNISFDGGKIFAPGGTVELGGLTTTGTLNISDDGKFIFPQEQALGDVSLANGGQVTVLADGGGSIFVNAKNLDLNSGSSFVAGIFPGLGSTGVEGGDITVIATDTILINGTNADNIPTGIINTIGSGATGDGGNINITANSLALTDGGEITSSTFGVGNNGNISLNIFESIIVDASGNSDFFSAIYNVVERGAIGNSGSINIATSNLELISGGQIVAITQGEGNSGNISLNITESFSIKGATDNSGFFSTVRNLVGPNAIGDAGNIDIAASNLTLSDGGQINAGTFGRGNGGDISLDITESIVLDKTNLALDSPGIISSRVEIDAVGDGGKIDISTTNLSINNGSGISTNTLGKGNAGSVNINSSESVSIYGTANNIPSNLRGGIFSAVDNRGIGNGGEINISTNDFNLMNGGIVSTATGGQGNAGNIFLNASRSTLIEGNSIDGESNLDSVFSSEVIENAVGDGGEINITTANLSLINDGVVATNSFGQGDAGSISIQADSLFLNDGEIYAESRSSESVEDELLDTSGQITLDIANGIILQNDSDLSAEAFNSATGGNLNIDAGFIIAFPNNENEIRASAAFGRGGNIEIDTKGLFISSENLITASSRLGIDGTVEISTPDINLQPELEQSELKLLTTEDAIANSCLARSSGQASFNVNGNDELTKNPNSNYSDANFSLTGIGSLSNTVKQPSSTQVNNSQRNQSTIPAEKMVKTEDDRILLVAAPQKAESIYCHSVEEK